MKTALRFATILTWFNLLFWGGMILLAGLGSLATGQMPMLFLLVLLSAIPLNCYAALQLQRSIRHPQLRLSNQTPTGIRFVGFVALFFAISFVGNGFTLISNAPKVASLMIDEFSSSKNMDPRVLSFITPRHFREMGVLFAFLGLFVGVNVVLNLRLLRWYYLVNQSDVTGSGSGRA